MGDKKEVVIRESSYVIHSKEKALKRSITEGSAQEVSNSTGSSFITPFVLAIGGNSFHIGLLSAVSALVSPIGQIFGSKAMEKHSRKKITINSRGWQILLWVPIIALSFFYTFGIAPLFLPYALIVFYSLFVFIQGKGHVAWFSWMGDLVSVNERGKYFAKRNRVSGSVGLITFIIAAFVLDYFKTQGYVLIGFSVLFFFSLIFREMSRRISLRIFNPELRIKKGYYFSFKEFVRRYDNFGKFAFFHAVFNLSIMVASPFFAVYMLEDLNFNYVTFTVVTLSSTFFYLVFSPLAGKFSDRYGNVKLLYIAGVMFFLTPIFWLFLKEPIALILLPGLSAGIANAALVIGVTNFTYDSVSSQKRGLVVAYMSILAGIGVFIGSLLGGFMIQYLNIDFMKPILFVFLISAILRGLVALFYLPQLKEERKTERMEGLHLNLLHPFKTIGSDIIWFKNFLHSK